MKRGLAAQRSAMPSGKNSKSTITEGEALPEKSQDEFRLMRWR